MTITPETINAVSDDLARLAIDRIAGRPVLVSVSGGKDSTAAALFLKEMGIPFQAVHCDTGWEHPDTGVDA